MIPRDGAKPLEVSGMRKALEDRRMWSGLGKVVLRDGENSHFEIETDENGNPVDVLVEMDIMPEQVPVTARLAGGMGSLGSGGWKIPAPGTEVAWIAPHGELESDLIIVATLSTNSIPTALDGDTFVLIQPKKIIIQSQGDDVEIESGDGNKVNLQGGDLAVARKTDPVDGGTLVFFPGSGGAALTYIPAGAPVLPAVLPTVNIKIDGGKISAGSDKTFSG